MSDFRTKARRLASALISPAPSLKRLRGPLTERELINLESKVGSELFGSTPKGVRREFFNLNPKTWIWYEERLDVLSKKKESHTTKYEVHEDHILKVQEGPRYTRLEGKELENFSLAIHIYYERVMRKIYNRHPKTGQKLS